MLPGSLFLILILANGCKTKFLRFVERCPTRSERRILSLYSECVSPEVYHCASDDDLKLVEICNEAIQLPPGNYPRYTSYTDRIFYDICPDNRHQPWPVKSNDIADCEVEKSTCNGVGQILCDHGTTTDDVTCRCDFKNGFVISGSSNCCSPSSTEDCYCEYRPCQNSSQELNADYACVDKCKAGYERKRGGEICSIIEVNNSKETSTQIIASGQAIGIILVKEQNIGRVAISIMTFSLVCFLVMVVYVLDTYDIRQPRITFDMKYHLDVYRLLEAAANGDLSTIKGVKDKCYIDLSDTDYDQRSALHLAASEGRINVVQYLLGHRVAHINAVDRWNNNASKDAETCINKLKEDDPNLPHYKKIVEALQKGTTEKEVNSYREQIANKLIHAAETGNLMRIKRLYRLGTDMDLANLSGRTALQAAVDKAQTKVIEYLLDECKVSPFVKWHNKRPKGPLLDAKRNALLLENSFEQITNHNLTREEKTIQLLLSASRGDIRNVRGFFKAGFDMNLADYDKRTALHVAVSDHQEHIVQYLIQECNVDITMKDRWGRTAVDEAIKNRKRDLGQLFGIRNKDLADTLSNECIAFKLLNAASLGNTDTLKSLHDDGCDMEMRDYDGRTALHLASAQGHLHCVKFLIETCKVKANIPDRNGRTPCVEASNRKKENSPNYDSILYILKAVKSQKPVEVMTNNQSECAEVKINDQSEEVNPILIINDAAAKGNLIKVKSLGWVQMNSGDYLKETPLHVAAAKGQIQLVKHLVENQTVSLFVRNSFWQTPIRLARKKCKDWKKKLGVQGTSLGLKKEKPHSEWEEYGRDLQSDSESDDEYVNKEVDKDIHDPIKVFREVSTYLCKKMREQIKDENVEEDKSLSRYPDDELTFLFLNNTFRGDIAAVKRYLPQVKKRELVNKPDYSQRTALHIAVSEGHYHLVIYFVKDLKVKTELKDRWGNTPKDDAERNKDQKMIDIIDKYTKDYS